MKKILFVLLACVSVNAEQFKTDSDVPTKLLQQNISELYLKEIRGKEVRAILIEGHTDKHGSDLHNLKLSARRAESAKKLLLALGVSPEKIQSVGMGKTQLLNLPDAENRRVVVRVFTNTSQAVFVYSDCTTVCKSVQEETRNRNILSAYVVRSQDGFDKSVESNLVEVSSRYENGLGIMYQREVLDGLWLGGGFDSNSGKFISLGLGF